MVKYSRTRTVIRNGGRKAKKTINMKAVYKFDTPFVGLAIHEDYMTDEVVKYLSEQNSKCVCASYDINPCSSAYPIDKTSKVILVLKYEYYYNIINKNDRIQGAQELNNYISSNRTGILGHATVNYGETQRQPKIQWVCIYNVCKHRVDENEKGMGSILFNSVVHTIKEMFPLAYLWLAVDPRNKYFIQALKTYCKYGFNSPQFIRYDPLGIPVQPFSLGLVKQPDAIHDDDGVSFPYGVHLHNRVKYGGIQTIQTNYPNYQIPFKFKIDEISINTLRLLPFSNSKTDKDGNILQYIENDANTIVEQGGSFRMLKAEVINDYTVFTLSVEKHSSSFISTVVGNLDSVQIPYFQIGFHTHPFSGYTRYSRIISPPSPADLVHIYSGGKTLQVFLHMVISVEGIYIIGANSNPYDRKELKINQDNKLYIVNRDDGTEQEVFTGYVQGTYQIMNIEAGSSFTHGNPGEISIVHERVERFITLFNNENQSSGNLFAIQFISWEGLTKETQMEINSLSTNQTTLVTYGDGQQGYVPVINSKLQYLAY